MDTSSPLIRLRLCSALALSLAMIGCGSTQNQNCPNCALGGAQFLMATTASGQILRFPINSGVGLGAPVSIPGPANSMGLAVGTAGGGVPFQIFVYVSDPGNNAIDGFSVSNTDGSLSALAGSPFPMGTASGGRDARLGRHASRPVPCGARLSPRQPPVSHPVTTRLSPQ